MSNLVGVTLKLPPIPPDAVGARLQDSAMGRPK
jgi:hypothetical protein